MAPVIPTELIVRLPSPLLETVKVFVEEDSPFLILPKSCWVGVIEMAELRATVNGMAGVQALNILLFFELIDQIYLPFAKV